MVIIGLDPGLTATGFGVVEDGRLLDYGVFKPDRSVLAEQKIKKLTADVEHLVKKYQPRVCGLETVFYRKNLRTALISSQLRGAFIYILSQYNVKITEVSPARVKLALTGNGRASKSQVQYMVKQLFKISVPLPADAADAIAIAFCAGKG